MRLYLVQHGEAVLGETDPSRPLSETGKCDVRRVADFLAAAGVRVSTVLHSGKLRAEQTAELCAAKLAPETAVEVHAGLNPNDPTGPFAQDVSGWDEDVIIVGHLPFMGRLVARLTAGAEAAEIAAFRPGSVACLERAENGGWTLAWMLRPELLPT